MTSVQDRLSPDTMVKVVYEDDEKPRFVLGYWSIRGLGSPLRMMLSAAASLQKVPHWIALYDVQESDNGAWNKDSYVRDKKWLKEEYNPLMNCPFLVDVERQEVIAHSNAIFIYLGNTLDMMGSNEHDRYRCVELLCEIMDLRDAMVNYAYNKSKGDNKEHAIQVMKRALNYFAKLEQHMQNNKSDCYLVGNKATAPDFHLWEMLHQFDGLDKSYGGLSMLWADHKHLKRFHEGFLLQPENRHWKETSFCHEALPYNNPYAIFGSTPSKELSEEMCYKRGQEAPWRNRGTIVEKITLVNKDDDGPPSKKPKL